MKLIVTLIGLILIVEGLPYAAFPEAMRRWLDQLRELEPAAMRKIGLVMLSLGLLLCYLAQRTEFLS